MKPRLYAHRMILSGSCSTSFELIWSPAKGKTVDKYFFLPWVWFLCCLETQSRFLFKQLVTLWFKCFIEILYFKSFFSERYRGFSQSMFDNTTPHILVLKKSCPYYGLFEMNQDIFDKLGAILPIVPIVNQVYQWLFKLIDLPSHLRVKF